MEPMDNFDPEINRIHTLECLKRLMILYDEENVCHCRQGQFLALYILFNVHSSDAVFTSLQLKDTFMYEVIELHCHIVTLELRSKDQLKFVFGVRNESSFRRHFR